MSPRYAMRRDANENGLVSLASALGGWMIRTDHPSDFLMWAKGNWEVVEIKDPRKEGHADEFTPSQKQIREEAARRGARLITWREQKDVLDYFGAKHSA